MKLGPEDRPQDDTWNPTKEEWDEFTKCTTCYGTGHIYKMGVTNMLVCPICKGTGKEKS